MQLIVGLGVRFERAINQPPHGLIEGGDILIRLSGLQTFERKQHAIKNLAGL